MSKLFSKIDDVLELEDYILPKKEQVEETTFDERILSRMTNFIFNLDTDTLSDEQVYEVMDIIKNIELIAEGNRLARKSLLGKNQSSKKWYRQNKKSIKNRKERFIRSAEGRKRSKNKGRLDRIGRTPTGRRNVKYNTRKRDRG